MHLEKGPEIYQKLVLRTCTFAPSEEVLMNEWNWIYSFFAFDICYSCCTFVLLVDVGLRGVKALSFKAHE